MKPQLMVIAAALLLCTSINASRAQTSPPSLPRSPPPLAPLPQLPPPTQSTMTATAAAPRSLLANFDPSATGYNADIGYALAYLTTLMYPLYFAIEDVGHEGKAAVDARERKLQTEPDAFLAAFIQRADPLLASAPLDYTFLAACRPNGYDPEAMVINLPTVVLVIFRGTDRVGCDAVTDETLLPPVINQVVYEAAEWLGTDFDLTQEPLRFPVGAGAPLFPGTVHRGFWRSLAFPGGKTRIVSRVSLRTAFGLPAIPVRRATVAARIPPDQEVLPSTMIARQRPAMPALSLAQRRAAVRSESTKPYIQVLQEAVGSYANTGSGTPKKIWIAGHSLGGAHAQIAGLFLKVKGLDVQGVVGVAGPNVGDRAFTDELERRFPGTRLTRTIFVQDPIPSISSDKVGFGSAGRIVHFDDMKTRRNYSDDSQVVTGGGALLRGVAGAVTALVPIESGLETMCFHHPQWYVWATWEELLRTNASRSSSVPRPQVPFPHVGDPFSPCSPGIVRRGTEKSLSDVPGEVVAGAIGGAVDAAMNFTYDLVYALGNEIGNEAFEGTYRFANYAAQRASDRRYLDRDGNDVNASGLGDSSADNEFIVRRSGIGGYTIGRPSSSRLLTPKAEGSALVFDNGIGYVMRLPEFEIPACPVWDPWCGDVQRLPTVEQTWRFYKLKEASNLFLVENRAGGKVVDMKRGCLDTRSKDCRVEQWSRLANDATQLWVLEKVR